MFHSNLNKALAWSRGCDIAVQAYRLLSNVDDKTFAERAIRNAFSLPESLASALIDSAAPSAKLDRSREALAVLQTQLFLAAECGLLPRPSLHSINLETELLADELKGRIAHTCHSCVGDPSGARELGIELF